MTTVRQRTSDTVPVTIFIRRKGQSMFGCLGATNPRPRFISPDIDVLMVITFVIAST